MSKYDFYSHVRYSECGEDGRLSLGAVVDYFQDTATFQGEHLGIGVSYLKKQHIAWILTSWQIITDHFPKLAEPVTVRTWAYDFRSFYGLRNLARCLGISKIYGVTNEGYYAMNHIRLDRKLKTDFAAFWKECEGEPCEADKRFYVMPVKEYRKDMSELKPSKRAQHRRRFEKLDAIDAAFDANCKKLLKG